MKIQSAYPTELRWPGAIVQALGDGGGRQPAQDPRASLPPYASFGPIELRTESGGGPSPIAILE